MSLQAIQGLLLAGLLRHAAQQAGQQAAVEAYDLLIAMVERWHGLQQQELLSSSTALRGGGAATDSTSNGRCGSSSGNSSGSGSQRPGGTASADPTSEQSARDVRLGRTLSAVHGLLRRPADLEKLLKMLEGMTKHAGYWKGCYPDFRWAPFCDAMRHLQQQHTLEAGSLVAAHLGIRAIEMACTQTSHEELHAIHHLALGSNSRALPLPLLRLLGVSMDEAAPAPAPAFGGAAVKADAPEGAWTPALPMALVPLKKWTKEEQQQRLRVVRGLVAAGASYSWEGPAGVTVLDLAAELEEPAFLQALLARPNALQAFTPEQVSAALQTAVRHQRLSQGCLLLEAAAAAGLRVPDGGEAAVFDGPQLTTFKMQVIAFQQLRQHSPLTQQQLQRLRPPPPPAAPAAAAAGDGAVGAAAASPPVLTHATAAAAARLVVWAVQSCNPGTLRRLLAAGADPNFDGACSPLHELVLVADAKGSNMVGVHVTCMPKCACPCPRLLQVAGHTAVNAPCAMGVTDGSDVALVSHVCMYLLAHRYTCTSSHMYHACL
jgi:hypothetical protein